VLPAVVRHTAGSIERVSFVELLAMKTFAMRVHRQTIGQRSSMRVMWLKFPRALLIQQRLGTF